MIPVPTGVRIWIATGHTDMRKGMQGLSLLVQESLGRDPFAGDVFVFRGRAGSLMKAPWHDGIGLSLYAKRLDRGRFVWPATVDGVVALAATQMSYLLEAIDWRNPQHTWRPQSAGYVLSAEENTPQTICVVIPSAFMNAGLEALPDDIDALKAALIVARAEAAAARAQQSDDQALIAHLKLQIEKLNRDRYGPRSERTARLLDQLELTLEELESSATEDELTAEMAAAKTMKVASFTRKRPSRQLLPEHLPRERLMVPGPTACACCGGSRLSKLGEDITETLEVIPKSWKVVQHVREKFTCRDCEKISQAPAPFHVIARGWAGPSLLAMILFEKFGQHQPLNRQAERYAKEGVPISLSTLAD